MGATVGEKLSEGLVGPKLGAFVGTVGLRVLVGEYVDRVGLFDGGSVGGV